MTADGDLEMAHARERLAVQSHFVEGQRLPAPLITTHYMMVVDGSAGCYVWPEDRVLIRRSEHPVRFVRLVDHEFFQVLRNKLGWGLPHIAKPDKG